MTGEILDEHLLAAIGNAPSHGHIAAIIDDKLRRHFRPSHGYKQVGIDVRTHQNRFYPIVGVLEQYCRIVQPMAARLAECLLRQHNDDAFYNSILENATEFSASLTSFWTQLHDEAQVGVPLENEVANLICGDALRWARQLCDEQKLAYINSLEPGSSASTILRGRCARDVSLFTGVWNAAASILGAPPSDRATPHRLNRRGESCLYGATSIATCLAELRLESGWLVAFAKFVPSRTVRLLNLTVLPQLEYTASLFAPDYDQRTLWTGILKGLTSEISKPSWPGDSERLYRPTQYFSAYVRAKSDLQVDGIAFPSSQDPGESWNVALYGGPELTVGDDPVLALDGEPFFIRTKRISVEYELANFARPVTAP